MRRGSAVAVVALAAALPRLAVLLRERDTILEEFVDKSDRFATTLVDHGTFGFLPGVPSAYTQPLYGWFLAGLYLPFGRSWLAVGIAQTIVAVVTALLVLEIGTRLRSTGIGVVAALVTTLHPYLVWHDVHMNREVLDGLLLALVVWLALLAYEDRGFAAAAATGVATRRRDPRERTARAPAAGARPLRRMEGASRRACARRRRHPRRRRGARRRPVGGPEQD